MERDARVDAYIERAAPFAQPILRHLRALVHDAVPEVVETIKWGIPHFMLAGKNLAGIAAFKAHAAFIVHGEGRQGVDERQGVEGAQGVEPADGMGYCGKLTRLEDLPPDAALRESLLLARARLESGPAAARKRAAPKPPRAEMAIPDDFASALTGQARAHFEALAPSYRREYLEWIVDAKRAETRARRIVQACAWLAEGKKRNWKYERC